MAGGVGVGDWGAWCGRIHACKCVGEVIVQPGEAENWGTLLARIAIFFIEKYILNKHVSGPGVNVLKYLVLVQLYTKLLVMIILH